MADVVRYEKQTAPRLKELIERNAVLLLSFGSVEQHSAHLPVGTDSLCSLRRVENIAARTGGVVFAPLLLGYSFNHVGMVGTISLGAETFFKVVTEILEQLCEQGWRRLIVFSGHAGNWGALELAVQKARERHPTAGFILARGLPSPDVSHQRERFIRAFDWHAGTVETALVAHYCPECLDEARMPPANVLPKSLRTFVESCRLDEIDDVLLRAMTPQKTERVSQNGNWGVGDPADYHQVPVVEAMNAYEDFFVRLIQRWDEWITRLQA